MRIQPAWQSSLYFDSIYWHPNRNIPGVEFIRLTGHLPAVAAVWHWTASCGAAIYRIVVITGDGGTERRQRMGNDTGRQCYKLDNLTISRPQSIQANIPD